jgi:4-aminobutyrate aminotransferase-like enzyme
LSGLDHLLTSMTAPAETAAMIIEPVLGEGGYSPAPTAFLDGIVERCRAHGILFVADEVQTGFGRTGRMFAVEHHDVEPDIICMAKGIASGFPLSALGTRRELDDRWPKGSHGGTYGGNPIGCAAALATIDVVAAPGFLDGVVARGDQLMSGLRELQAHDPGIRQVRGLGLMVGVELADPARAAAIAAHCLHEGRLILMSAGTYNTVLRWMPPLVVSAAEIDEGLGAFAAALKATG